MSNHMGSYMLNNVLHLLDEKNVFQLLGREKTLELLQGINRIGCEYDCNDGEILETIGEKLTVCYICWEYHDILEEGICHPCKEKWKF